MTIAHADGSGFAVITCPFCSIVKKVSVSKFKELKHKISTRCQCGESFELLLNFRANYRKSVKLPGTYKVLTPTVSTWKDMMVFDLSRSGIGITIYDPVVMNVGDTLHVRFLLDDSRKTAIDKKVIVKIIKGHDLGCEFKDLALEEKELGFYLFS